MKKPDDHTITTEQYKTILQEAEKRLQSADAFGQFPTPVNDIMDAAQIILAPHDILNDSFLKKLRYTASNVLKSAMEKVWGIFDATARMIFIDKSVLQVKQTFLKLHEVGHAALPHQNKIFSLFEDGQKSLDPETSELFDREANVFATEVLFQLDEFESNAADFNFGINVPMRLSKRYGASIYASIRRYVQRNKKTCIVLILNQPTPADGLGFIFNLRRLVVSPSFEEKFGLNFPDRFTSNDEIGALVPIHRGMSRPSQISLTDKNGDKHECIAEGFNSSYQIFILIHVKKSLSAATTIILPKNSSFLGNV